MLIIPKLWTGLHSYITHNKITPVHSFTSLGNVQRQQALTWHPAKSCNQCNRYNLSASFQPVLVSGRNQPEAHPVEVFLLGISGARSRRCFCCAFSAAAPAARASYLSFLFCWFPIQSTPKKHRTAICIFFLGHFFSSK